MAELAAADPFSPPSGLSSNSNFVDPLLLADDLYLPSGGLSSEIDLDFDFDGIDWDISVDDLLLPEDASPPSHPSHTLNGGSPPESGLLISSFFPAISGSINISSPDFGNSANCSTESGSNVKQEDKTGWGTNMINKYEEGSGKFNINPRSSEFGLAEDSSFFFNAGSKEEEKKKARLMRNRESAQLSRQRKKEYVEELEEKVRSMTSTITELNGKIAFFMAENSSLKQQLGGSGGNGFSPAVYPQASIASMHFPWVYPALAFRHQGSPVPLVPIPKLNSQPAAPSQTTTKTEKKQRGRKTRKVASITVLGFLFFVLIFGGLIGRVDHTYKKSRDFGAVTIKNSLLGNPNGVVLSVSGRPMRLTSSEEIGVNNGNNSKGEVGKRFQNGKVGSEDKSWPSNDRMIVENSSETLPALLYFSRNGKHVEINGNLIINSVIASDKAVAQIKSRDQPKKPSGNDDVETGLVIANLDSRVALSTMDVGGRTKSYGSSAEYHPVLASDSDDTFMDTSQDGFLQQWFLEGIAGPLFNTGTCTEVFQFQISPSSACPSSVVTSPIINSTETANASSGISNTSLSANQQVIKNRRFLYPQAIPLPGSTLNHTERIIGKGSEGSFQSNASGPPIVVSVLIDPRDASDDDGETMKSPSKSLQRIFVVVLLDSVKYVTYSCVLPFKSHSLQRL